ncbi:MAG TPA: hypothetical protein VIJ64_01840, partial [Candidatus Lustribacter sp.]
MRRTFPRPALRRVALIAGFAVLFLVAFAAAAHDTIERIVLERALGGAFGGNAAIATLRHADGLTVIEGVRLQTAGSSATVTADRIAYVVTGDSWDVRPTGLHVTIDVDRLTGDELGGARNAAHALNIGRLLLHVKNAAVTFTRGTAGAPKVELVGVDGTLDANAQLGYDLHGSLIAATGAYPFAARALADAGAGGGVRWTAAALPLAPIAALLDNGDLAVTDGEARDVTFTSAGGLRGTFTLAGVRASIAGHDVHGLAG